MHLLSVTHTQMQLAIGEWQLKPMVKRSETNEPRTNDENQVRNNKTKCRHGFCCFLFCVVFRVLCLMFLFFSCSFYMHANELRQSEMDIKVFPDALVLLNISATHVARLARVKERERERMKGFSNIAKVASSAASLSPSSLPNAPFGFV